MDPLTSAQPAAPAAAPLPRIPLDLPPSNFTDRAKVTRTVPLAYPVTFAGRDWTSIGIRRLSIAQIAAVFANFTANRERDPAFPFELPVFVDEAGADLPPGLLDQLDPDDTEAVNEAVEGFTARRFRVRTDPSTSSSETGASTEA